RIDAVKHMGQEATRIFCAAIHEFTQSLGKERFFLAGEVTGGRGHAWSMVDTTGLDGGLGVGDIPGRLASMVKGLAEPNERVSLSFGTRHWTTMGISPGSASTWSRCLTTTIKYTKEARNAGFAAWLSIASWYSMRLPST